MEKLLDSSLSLCLSLTLSVSNVFASLCLFLSSFCVYERVSSVQVLLPSVFCTTVRSIKALLSRCHCLHSVFNLQMDVRVCFNTVTGSLSSQLSFPLLQPFTQVFDLSELPQDISSCCISLFNSLIPSFKSSKTFPAFLKSFLSFVNSLVPFFCCLLHPADPPPPPPPQLFAKEFNFVETCSLFIIYSFKNIIKPHCFPVYCSLLLNFNIVSSLSLTNPKTHTKKERKRERERERDVKADRQKY